MGGSTRRIMLGLMAILSLVCGGLQAGLAQPPPPGRK